jgi:hypothetical protein
MEKFYNDVPFTKIIKSSQRRVMWAGHVARMGQMISAFLENLKGRHHFEDL